MSYTLLLHEADRHARQLREHREPRQVRNEFEWERRRRRAFARTPQLTRSWMARGVGASL
jgi:hypothetical protein